MISSSISKISPLSLNRGGKSKLFHDSKDFMGKKEENTQKSLETKAMKESEKEIGQGGTKRKEIFIITPFRDRHRHYHRLMSNFRTIMNAHAEEWDVQIIVVEQVKEIYGCFVYYHSLRHYSVLPVANHPSSFTILFSKCKSEYASSSRSHALSPLLPCHHNVCTPGGS